MKKHLIAAGVVAAFAAPAMAQNVSVYGIVDVNYSYLDTDNKGGDSAMGDSALSTSRLGFRGTEDLGGGLKAEFQLEGTLAASTGTLGTTGTATTSGSTTTTTASNVFNREAWVGVSGGFGHVRMGTTDVTNHQDIDTKVSMAGNLAFQSGEIGGDQKKTVRYISPVFSGFQIEAGYASPTSTATADGEKSQGATGTGNVTALYGSYEKGPLGVYVGYATLKVSQTYDQTQKTIGAKYDFGPVRVGLMAMSSDAAAEVDKATKGFDNRVVSAALPLGNGVTAHAAYESSKSDVAQSADFTSWTAAVTKDLSKRTTVYGALISTDYELQASNDAMQYTVGIRHQF